jgi:hypothetical protein
MTQHLSVPWQTSNAVAEGVGVRSSGTKRGLASTGKRRVLVALGFSDPERRSNHLGSSNPN